MIQKTSPDLTKFYQQYPRIPIIITAQANEKKNALTVARHCVASTDPPYYGIGISSSSFTYQLIAESKEFGVNFLPYEKAELVDSLGSTKGMEIDKFQKFNITLTEPEKTSVPILKAAYAAYECKVIDDIVYGRSHWIVGEVVVMHSFGECMAPPRILDVNMVNPLLCLGEQRYLTVSKETLKRVLR